MSETVVLLVEDDHDLRTLYRNTLKIAGFIVREAADGLTALQRIEEAAPTAVILDLMLPRITGYGVLHDLAAQAHTRKIPVIVVTGTEDVVEHPSVTCVLRKPVTPEELVRRVRRCIADAGAL